MNIGYLLFMGLLCTTLTLWAIVAIRDDGQGVSKDDESAPEQAVKDTETASSEPQGEQDALPSDEKQR